MNYNPEQHHRRSIRLKEYDYAKPGAYFVTLCVQDRVCLFGDVVDDKINLTHIGCMVDKSWKWLAKRYCYVELDEYVIMPNHLHGIIIIKEDGDDNVCRGGSRTSRPVKNRRKSLGRLIGAYKTISTKQINQFRRTTGEAVWQRNYFEHIIRNEKSLTHIREYILNNPLRWAMDPENPRNLQ